MKIEQTVLSIKGEVKLGKQMCEPYNKEKEIANLQVRLEEAKMRVNAFPNDVNELVPSIWGSIMISKWTKAKIDMLLEGMVAIYHYQAFPDRETPKHDWTGTLLSNRQLLRLTTSCRLRGRDNYPINMPRMAFDQVFDELYPRTPKKEIIGEKRPMERVTKRVTYFKKRLTEKGTWKVIEIKRKFEFDPVYNSVVEKPKPENDIDGCDPEVFYQAMENYLG
jgi:hypothetical protein